MDGGDGCTNMNVLNGTESQHLKMVQMINIMLCAFYCNKKKVVLLCLKKNEGLESTQ